MIIKSTRSRTLGFTHHARAKMQFYKLSESRIKHVLYSPKRTEEGVAPKTVAAMQPGSIKRNGLKETWSQEIWVMYQDNAQGRTIISAWRYPGVTKARSEVAMSLMRQEYDEFLSKTNKNKKET